MAIFIIRLFLQICHIIGLLLALLWKNGKKIVAIGTILLQNTFKGSFDLI